MSYIGAQPPVAPNEETVFVTTTQIATAGQTSFSVNYTVGYLEVYLNGSRLFPGDFTATTGSTVVLGSAAALNDEIMFVAQSTQTITNTLRPIDIGTSVQAKLVSGTNIKTVGGASLLGSGDVPVGLNVATVSSTSQTATSGNLYVLTNAAQTTLTLPATPSSSDTVAVTISNNRTDNIIARNGQTIMGLTEDMTVDNANATVTLRYLNNTWRIV